MDDYMVALQRIACALERIACALEAEAATGDSDDDELHDDVMSLSTTQGRIDD